MKRIGLYLNNLDEWYQVSIYERIKEETEKLGYELICVQGFTLSNIDSFHFDGVLTLSSVLITNRNKGLKKELESFVKRVPTVSIGKVLNLVPSVTINCKKSMSALMDHLILHHHYRRFLFLGGPEFQPDNIAREKVFKSKISSYKEKFPQVSGETINGEFHESSGINLLTSYIKNNPKNYLDCIVCANDYIAFGAYKALLMETDQNWQKCGITGYDDVAETESVLSNLTTINQPLDKLCKIAVSKLDDLIKKNNITLNSVVNSELVIRSSCGCSNLKKSIKNKNITNMNIEDKISQTRQETIRLNQYLRTVTFFGQNLTSIDNLSGLIHHIKGLLNVLNIDSFNLLLSTNKKNIDSDSMRLIYQKESSTEKEYTDREEIVSLLSILNMQNINKNSIIVSNLISGDEHYGLIVYRYNPWTNAHLCASFVFISNGLKLIENIEKEKKRSKELEKIVQLRTKDLIKVSNKLQEEAKKRLEVEAEVLKISEVERMRFSMDLHDDICQRLGGIAMYSKSISTKPELEELSLLIDDTLTRTRQYAHNSFPIDLRDIGLKNAVESLCINMQKQAKIETEYRWEIADNLTIEENINIFRIIQEALNNIVKHSHATKVTVTGVTNSNYIKITISDNGIGSEKLISLSLKSQLGNNKPQGLGLRSMEYRAHQINATYNIESIPDSGIKVTLLKQINL